MNLEEDLKMSLPIVEAANPAQQAAIAINMKKKGKKPKSMNEGSLHKWFKGSKSKDGKGGWVNVVTGGTCASDEPGEGTPKCVSSSKRASMSKKERLSAARRKKKADPNQQSKTGAAKPTYVATDKKKKKMNESKDLKKIAKELDGASKMHKGQANRVRKHIKDMHTEEKKPRNCGCGKDPCITYGKQEEMKEAKSAAWQRKEGKRESGGLNQKGVDSYRRENPGSKLKTAVTTKPSKLKKGSKSANRRKSFCARMSGMKKKLTSAKTANDPDSRINKSLRKWNCSYEPDGTPIMEEDKAFNFVLDKIRKEVGKDGYVSKNNPRKPQTPQQKAKVRAHQAKVDAENAAERKKDPSQGRYPKG